MPHEIDSKESAATCLSCGASSGLSLWAKATDREYRTTDAEYNFLKCAACESLSIHPVPADALQQIYPSNYYSFGRSESLGFKVKTWLDQRYFTPLLRSIAGDTLSALDIGGGAGWELNILKQADPRIALTQVVDFDPGAEKLAVANGHRYFCGRIEDFSATQTFDVILMLNLIEHVQQPLDILAKARSLLSPNGIIILKTPNTDSLDARLFRHKNWGGYHCPRHWVLFTNPGLTALVQQAGLRVVQAKYTQGAPFWATSVLFFLEDKGLITITPQRSALDHPLFPLLSIFFAGIDFIRGIWFKTSQMFFILTPKVD